MQDIREVVKLLQVPGASKCRSIDKSFVWEKERGHADRQLTAVHKAARTAGWTDKEPTSFASPDGNVVSHGTRYFSPDGSWMVLIIAHYGVVAYENWFKIEVNPVRPEVEEE